MSVDSTFTKVNKNIVFKNETSPKQYNSFTKVNKNIVFKNETSYKQYNLEMNVSKPFEDDQLTNTGSKTYKENDSVTIVWQAISSTGETYYFTADGKAFNKDGIDITEVDNISVADLESLQLQEEAEKEWKDQIAKEIVNLQNSTYTDNTASKDVEKLLNSHFTGVFGAPYQFDKNTDCRLQVNGKDSYYGRVYTEKIITKTPLLLLAPGEPDFLPSFSKTEANNIVEKLVNGGDSDLSDLISETGRYYTFKFMYSKYYKYVNDMCHQCAVNLGIYDVKHPDAKGNGVPLGTYRWENSSSAAIGDSAGFSDFMSSAAANAYIAFYADSKNNASLSFDNDTTQSQLLNSFNDWAATSKEIAFLAGPVAGIRTEALNAEGYQATMNEINNIVNGSFLSGSKIFNNLAEGFSTIGKGGRLLFPDIYNDSSASRASGSINVKLRSPDCDKISWYLNICVPLIHILALAMPRAMGPNGYYSPFLVRGSYKGVFNIDMGIITNLDIDEGGEGEWTLDYLPTSVDVSFTIKELYNVLAMSNNSDGTDYKFIRNTAMMDFLGNLCGVNIYDGEIERIVNTYLYMKKNQIKDIYANRWLDLQNTASNYALKAFNKLLKIK